MGAIRLCFLLLCPFLASATFVEKLNNTNDLKNTKFGSYFPHHGLQLLFWFAQRVDVQHDAMYLTSNMKPLRGDYGFHRFRNHEEILPSLSSGESYHGVGNLNYPAANHLPGYVRENQNSMPESNMDRLFVCLHRNTPQRILNVFIAAHIYGSNSFDSSHTFEITPELILQLRQPFRCTTDQNNVLRIKSSDTEETEGNRCRQFMDQMEYYKNNRRQNKRSLDSPYNKYEGIKLEIKANAKGNSKLKWKIPDDIIKTNAYVYIDICQNIYSSDTNKVCSDVKRKEKITKASGTLDTSVSLNAGLQPRLQLYSSYWNYYSRNPVTLYGLEFDGANRVIPTRIKGFDASLQLYAEDGKASARLYIKKTFTNWKKVFSHSWVGFYRSSQDKNKAYSTYQYADKFKMIKDFSTDDYDIYYYKSNLVIAPGVQLRFLLDKKYENNLAQTTPWEGVVKTPVLPSNCQDAYLLPKVPSPWADPELFYKLEFYDANSVFPIPILNSDAGLQLFTKDGKACALLYIKKTFRNWKDTFYDSWVGFYSSSQKANKKYDTYQYAVKFEKMEDGTKNYDMYQYKSSLAIASGVQIRFLKDTSYDHVLVKTEPWKSG